MVNDATTSSFVSVTSHTLYSTFLTRDVLIDIYSPSSVEHPDQLSLLLINDGQDLPVMPFADILSGLYTIDSIEPLLSVGIHCGTDRKNEYGTVGQLQYLGYGAKAKEYTRFVMEELLPFLKNTYQTTSFKDQSFAGFSLGGLSALDIVVNHPNEFKNVGVFSGSLWWRSRGYGRDYNDDTDRIMHAQIRRSVYSPRLSFFFECGALDELADRNNNGIIDSIDDTLDLIDELKKKGYSDDVIKYVELADGMHNVATWARAFPEFLRWQWGKQL